VVGGLNTLNVAIPGDSSLMGAVCVEISTGGIGVDEDSTGGWSSDMAVQVQVVIQQPVIAV
jgi:hypothetical protein